MATTLKRPGLEPSDQASVRLAQEEARKIDGLVSAGFFLNRSDFVRAAVREKLGSLRVEVAREVPEDVARKEIVTYLQSHPVAYPSDMASDLQLDVLLVKRIVDGMLAKDELREG